MVFDKLQRIFFSCETSTCISFGIYTVSLASSTHPCPSQTCVSGTLGEGLTGTCLFGAPGAADETLLPCEFCEELYPEELLIDHQVGVCYSSGP